MKKYMFFIILILLSCPLFTLEFGGAFGNITGIATHTESTTNITLTQRNDLAFYLKSYGKNLSFSTEGMYIFTPDRPFMLSLDHLFLLGNYPVSQSALKSYSYKIGRFQTHDPTTLVFNHRIDGLQFKFGYTNAELKIAAGFTGLILHPRSSITLTKADTEPWISYFAPPRLLSMLQFNRYNLFTSQTISVFTLFQQDVRAQSTVLQEGETVFQPNAGGKLDTQYYGFSLYGPLHPILRYSIYGIFNTGRTMGYLPDSESLTGFSYQYSTIAGFMAGIRFSLNFPQFLNSSVNISGVYTSGDSDYDTYLEGNRSGKGTLFIPISSTPLGNIFSPKLGNISIIGIQYVMQPFAYSKNSYIEEMTGLIDAFAFFRNSAGPISENGLDPASEEMFLGSEVDFSISYKPVSDFAIDLFTGLFFRNTGAFTDSVNAIDFTAGIKFVLSF